MVFSEFRINEKFSFARLLVYDWHYTTGFSYTNTIKDVVSGQVWEYMLGIPAHGKLRQRTVCWRIAWATKTASSLPELHRKTLLQETKWTNSMWALYNPCTSVLKHKSPFLVRFPDFPKAKFLNHRTRDSLGQLILFWGTLLPCRKTVPTPLNIMIKGTSPAFPLFSLGTDSVKYNNSLQLTTTLY